jgi:CheY-like chemotaxis protein
MMPEMDGVEATSIIRNKIGTEYAQSIPIIALTANAVVGTDKMFLANGFQDFLSKPIDIIKMDEVINIWIRDKEKEKELGLDIKAAESASASQDVDSAVSVFAGVSIEGLDIEAGLARFGDDDESYLSTLRSYAQNTPPLIDAVRKITAENLPQVAVTVHGIKGSSFSISANAIGSLAEELEYAAKAGDITSVSKNIGAFITKTEDFLADLGEFLEQVQTTAEGDKVALERPDPRLLADLAQACMSYQMDVIDELLFELKQYRYERDAELVEWIEGELVNGEFTTVAVRLTDG